MVLGVTPSETCGSSPCSRSPLRAAGTATFSAVASGAAHTCGLDTSGNALCWGYNVLGELGNTNYGTSTTTPQAIGGGKTFSKLSSGYRFSCALDSTGALNCWGYGDEGELATLAVGNCTQGNGTYLCSITPVAATTTEKFSQIVLGAAFGCGLSTANAIFCWGYGGDGQQGTGSLVSNGSPTPISVTGPWSAVAAGYFHVCALKSSGAAFCWGSNDHAQLGDGSKVFSNSTPQAVLGGKTFTQIVAGAHHTCGLMADGSAWCWGGDAVQQLGKG
jgi:alpha-tubulin suppressor-like RCC1 family protein